MRKKRSAEFSQINVENIAGIKSLMFYQAKLNVNSQINSCVSMSFLCIQIPARV